MTDPDISPIWLTAKTRMAAEKRLRNWALLAHLSLSWFSFWLIAASVWAAFNDVDWRYNAVNILLSVFVFGLTLIFYGFRFEERAAQFRECYLQLQALYRGSASSRKKMDRYHEVLLHYPNHSEADWDAVRFDAWLSGTKLTNSAGPIELTAAPIFRTAFRKVLGIAVAAFVLGFPAMIYVYA